MKKWNDLFIQIFKFGIVGVVCFVIDYGLMIVLTEVVGIHYLISSGISFSISVSLNYLLSMRFVFESKDNINKILELFIFIILSIVGLGLNELIMWIGAGIIQWNYMVVKIGATAIVLVYNFITRKIFIEKH